MTGSEEQIEMANRWQEEGKIGCFSLTEKFAGIQDLHILYCIVLYCTVLHCTVLYCAVVAVLYCTVQYYTVLHSTVLYCTVLTVLY